MERVSLDVMVARFDALVRRVRSVDPFQSWLVVGGAAVLAWAVGCELTSTTDLTTLGLLGALSPLWYLGVVLAVVTVLLALRSSSPTNARPLAGATVVVLLVLHGTAPLVYDTARFAWTYKHIGFADYFARFHDNDRDAVDIYHAFPAFFSSLGVVAGTVTSRGLQTLARWWPLLVELSSVLLIRRIVAPIRADRRLPWATALLFLVVNWIGQDYLSPQSVSFVLALTIYAIVFRQFRRGDEVPAPAAHRWTEAGAIVAVLACWVAIVVSHPLTPFVILPGLFVGFPLLKLRPRWLPTVMAVIVGAYVFMERGIVEDQGIGKDIGNVVVNVQGRGTTNGAVATRVPEFHYYFLASMGISALVLLLAAIGARSMYRSVGGRRFVALGCQAVSPTLFLLVESYGQEGILRAFLFASPWFCLFAALPLLGPPRERRLRQVLLPLMVGGVAVLSCVALFVRDLQYAVAPTDVEVVRAFEDMNPQGALLIGTGVLPEKVTATYFRQRYVVLSTAEHFADGTVDTRTTLDYIKDEIEGFDRSVFIAFGPSLTNRSVFDGRMTTTDLTALQQAVDVDASWTLVFRDGPSSLYKWVGS